MQAAVHRPRGPGMARGRRGQSLVELAVAFPLLLLLVAGVLDLAHALSVTNIVANVAREGARHGASRASDTDIQTRVVQEAAGAPLTLDCTPGGTCNAVTITRLKADGTTDSNPGGTQGDSITVDVTYDVPLLLAQALGLGTLTVDRHATMVVF